MELVLWGLGVAGGGGLNPSWNNSNLHKFILDSFLLTCRLFDSIFCSVSLKDDLNSVEIQKGPTNA